ncbi:hypothetical protein BB560_003412, partial [Smittium megazygosporum]
SSRLSLPSTNSRFTNLSNSSFTGILTCKSNFTVSTTTHTAEKLSSVKSRVEGQIAASPNILYSKTYCPFCSRAKNELDKLGIAYSVVELDVDPNGSDIQALLAELTGQRTVPNIFLNHKHVGGCDDLLYLLETGKINDYIKV